MYVRYRVQLKCDGARWRTGGEVKGKLANAVGSQYASHYRGTRFIQHYYRWCAHLGCASSRLNWRPHADLNGLFHFAERRNLVPVLVPSYFQRSLQSKCLRLASGIPWYVSDTRGSGCSFVCRTIQSPDCEIWLKVSRCGELDIHLRWLSVDPVVLRENQWLQGPTGQSRTSFAMAKLTKRIAFGAAPERP